MPNGPCQMGKVFIKWAYLSANWAILSTKIGLCQCPMNDSMLSHYDKGQSVKWWNSVSVGAKVRYLFNGGNALIELTAKSRAYFTLMSIWNQPCSDYAVGHRRQAGYRDPRDTTGRPTPKWAFGTAQVRQKNQAHFMSTEDKSRV